MLTYCSNQLYTSIFIHTLFFKMTAACTIHLLGGVAQWHERQSRVVNFPCRPLDLQLMGDH